MTAHSDKPAHHVGKQDAIAGTRKTACGKIGMRGMMADELVVGREVIRVSRAWSFVTCEACKRRQVAGISESMVDALAYHAAGGIRNRHHYSDATMRGLALRGLLISNEVTQAGRDYLASRKGKR
jgi:hypothetical protein